MAKPSPYFRTQEQAQELVKARDTFAWDDPTLPDAAMVIISGAPAMGKTHLAMTMASVMPVYHIDTERRGGFVSTKFQHQYPGKVKYKVLQSYLDIVVAIKNIIKHQPRGTIIIDSGTDLQTYAEFAYLEETGKDKVGLPFNWSEVYYKVNAVLNDVRTAGFPLVMTTRVKEEYVGEKATGTLIPRIYKEAPHMADFTFLFKRDAKLYCTKNSFNFDKDFEVDARLGLPAILSQLQQQSLTQRGAA